MLPRELKVQKLIAVALTVFLATVASAWGDSYPSRPITIVVPFPAGGPTDTLGRILAERMTVTLGQSAPSKPNRCRRHHRHRARRPLGAGWLHDHSRPLADARHQRRDLHAFVRSGERTRADIAGGGLSGVVHRKSRVADKGLGGADRLAEGQSRQGDGGNRRRRRRSGCCRDVFPEEHRHALSFGPTAAPHP